MMISRRELSAALGAAFAVAVSEGSGSVLRAAARPRQNSAASGGDRMDDGVQTLMREPLAPMPNAEAEVITLTLSPGSNSAPHEHTGPVFAYLLEGEIENQVDPNPPRRYKPGEFFYEPPMHVHRMMRNLSSTKPAKLLIFQVGQKGKPFTIPVR